MIGGMHDKRAFAATFKHLHDCSNLVSNEHEKPVLSESSVLCGVKIKIKR